MASEDPVLMKSTLNCRTRHSAMRPLLAESVRSPQDLYEHRLIQCDVQMLQWKG